MSILYTSIYLEYNENNPFGGVQYLYGVVTIKFRFKSTHDTMAVIIHVNITLYQAYTKTYNKWMNTRNALVSLNTQNLFLVCTQQPIYTHQHVHGHGGELSVLHLSLALRSSTHTTLAANLAVALPRVCVHTH